MKIPTIYLSSNIKFLRAQHKKTQNDLAKLCGKKNTAISNWEKIIREPSSIDLAILANYFNVNVDDFLLKDLRNDIKND